MSDVKEVAKAFSMSGIIGKILVTFVIIFVIIFVYSNVQNTITLAEFVKQNRNIETLIKNQAEMKIFKRCVKNACDTAETEFNNSLLMTLGKILKENKVEFPQELNIVILKFREKLTDIKDCLIFPEELK